jgi:hypothetical protein
MSKISILEKFAQDAINAPALVTGGGKGCKRSKKSKSKKSKCKRSGSRKSGSRKSRSRKSGSGRTGGHCGWGCYVPPPCKW